MSLHKKVETASDDRFRSYLLKYPFRNLRCAYRNHIDIDNQWNNNGFLLVVGGVSLPRSGF